MEMEGHCWDKDMNDSMWIKNKWQGLESAWKAKRLHQGSEKGGN